jgi:hypothetical protein
VALLPLSDIVTMVQDLVPSPQLTEASAKSVIRTAHRLLGRQYQWSYRRREALLQTVAQYSTGTVTVTAGSGTVTGASTAWTAAMVGRQIRIDGEDAFFFVQSVNVSAQTLVLADAQLASVVWAAASASGAGYAIFVDQYEVPLEVAIIMSEVKGWPLMETSQMEIDFMDPRRTLSASAGTPTRWYWCRTRITANVQHKYVGIWPVPSTAMTLRMPYLVEPPEITADTDLPVVPAEVLELAGGMRAAIKVFGVTGDARWAEVAKACQQALLGTAATPSSPGMFGVLQQALHDDEHRFGNPTRLGGTVNRWGTDEWALRDFEAMGL